MRLMRVDSGDDGRSRLEDLGEVALAALAPGSGYASDGMTVAVLGESAGDGAAWYVRRLEPGGSMDPHVYPGDEAACFQISGTLTLLLDDGSQTPIQAGDVVLIRGGATHAWRNDGDEPSVTGVGGTGPRAI